MEYYISQIQHILDDKSASRVFVVRGRNSYIQSGAKCLIDVLVRKSNVCVDEFYEFSSNPKEEDVKKGLDLFLHGKYDVIIAIGGGSVIDMAKLIKHYSKCFEVPIIAIPTTSGTGAEATGYAVCYIDGIKQSIGDEYMLPNYTFLIPSLTLNNNSYLTKCTAFDAFAQAVEAFWNVNATDESDYYAFTAINMIYKNLINYNEDYNTRANLMIGANLAGKAINITKTTAPHAMSYTMTSKYGYPHGHAVALTFPYFFDLNVRCKETVFSGTNYDVYHSKMVLLCDIFGLNESDYLFEFMKEFVNDIGLGYDDNRPIDIAVVENGINLERSKNNPHIINVDIVKKAAESIFKNKL